MVIGDDVEIGSNTAIDRATIGSTKIGDMTKIDNLVHIAHNVNIGKGCLITAQVGIAGSVTIGSYCTFGGQAASSILGGQNTGNILSKITTWFAVVFLSLAILISLLSGPESGTSPSLVKQAADERPALSETESVLSNEELILDLGDK